MRKRGTMKEANEGMIATVTVKYQGFVYLLHWPDPLTLSSLSSQAVYASDSGLRYQQEMLQREISPPKPRLVH